MNPRRIGETMKKLLLVLLICIFNLGAGAVCWAAESSELMVSAAASLRNVMQSSGSLFESRNPGVKVYFNFASSGVLSQQVLSGAPVDIFISADIKEFDRFASAPEILAQGYPQIFLKNTLCFVAASHIDVSINSIEDLTDPRWQKIALGNPGTVPAGRYAEQSLRSALIFDGLKNRYIFCENVRQVLDYVVRGEVDGGFVYQTDVNSVSGDSFGSVLVIDEALHEPIIYGLARVASGQNPELSDRFIEFLREPEVKQIFIDAGFRFPAKSGD